MNMFTKSNGLKIRGIDVISDPEIPAHALILLS